MLRTRLSQVSLVASLLAVLALAAAPASDGSLQVDVHLAPSGDLQTGTIEGRVTRAQRPRRRVADRYGRTGGGARERPDVPLTVHLDGAGAAGSPAGGEPPRMEQRDTAFVPPALTIPVGTTIDFPNEDPFFHNVFSYSRTRRFDLGRYPAGESKSVRFDTPGYVKVFCEVHQWMRAGILVAETPFHQVVDADGTFRIENVPAGRYEVVVNDFDRGEEREEVEVVAGGTSRVEIELR